MKLTSDVCKNFIIGQIIADNEISRSVKSQMGVDAPPLSLLNPKNWSQSQKYIAKSDDDIAKHDNALRALRDILGESSAYGMSNIVFGDMPTYPCTVRMFYTTAMCPLNVGDPNDPEDHELYEVLVEVWLISDSLDVSILGASILID